MCFWTVIKVNFHTLQHPGNGFIYSTNNTMKVEEENRLRKFPVAIPHWVSLVHYCRGAHPWPGYQNVSQFHVYHLVNEGRDLVHTGLHLNGLGSVLKPRFQTPSGIHSQYINGRAWNVCFNRFPRWFLCILKPENDCIRNCGWNPDFLRW